MQKPIVSKLSLVAVATTALAVLLLSGPTQAGPIEDQRQAVTKFRSLFDNSVCTGYQVFNNLFVTEARCLDTDSGVVNGLYNLDFENEGLQSIEVYSMKPMDEKNVLFLKKDGGEAHRRVVRAGRDDVGATTAHPHTTGGAGFRDGNMTLMGATLLLLLGLVTMKQ